MARILVVDDQRNVRTTLAMMLRAAGHTVDEAGDGERAVQMVTSTGYELVLTDLKMDGMSGIDVLRQTRQARPDVEVIVMTAFGTIENAVEAMRLGAHDYIQKPFTEVQLLDKVSRALRTHSESAVQPERPGTQGERISSIPEPLKGPRIIGRSNPMREVLSRIAKAAPTDATVLITGESGTGKELVARAIHANSRRATLPFISVNCAAVTETLLESELFGHTKGAFTGAVQPRKGLFEEADGATFFLDEIAETTPAFQAKLLRTLQEGEVRRVGDNKVARVDVRIIAATNQDLHTAIAQKSFRQDLYYRLNVVRFVLPPLRERREDIPQLVEFFLDKLGKKMGTRGRLGEGVMDFLSAYEFPGNIREMENLIEQGLALSNRSGLIELEDIAPADIQHGTKDRANLPPDRSLKPAVDEAERHAIESALRQVDGNRERAAELLGLSPTTLWRKMKRLTIQWPS